MGGFSHFREGQKQMNLFVYSDESGVFDKVHNNSFVFGGVIFFSKEEKDIAVRKYRNVEKCIRTAGYDKDSELKACKITNAEKGKIFRSLNGYCKFGVVIDEKRVLDSIFTNKKDKQRYLDFAYKIGLKRCFEKLIEQGRLNAEEVEGLYIFADEHTTATSGLYELQEALEQEYKRGTYNYYWNHHYPPIFPNIKTVQVKFCNSENQTLIRAADIVANRLYYASEQDGELLKKLEEKMYLTFLP